MTELCGKFHRNYDLTAADYLVFPVHKPGHCIIIIIADIQHEEVLFFDPLSLGLKIDHLHLRWQSNIWILYQCQGAILEPLGNTDIDAQKVIPYKETISCGLFCLLYAYSIIHGVAMNFTQVDMPVFRKRMAFDILSGKATRNLLVERGEAWK